jgi:hypothetical protein
MHASCVRAGQCWATRFAPSVSRTSTWCPLSCSETRSFSPLLNGTPQRATQRNRNKAKKKRKAEHHATCNVQRATCTGEDDHDKDGDDSEDIDDDDEIDPIGDDENKFNINIRMATGRIFTVSTKPDDTIDMLKRRISARFVISKQAQRLIFGNEELNDEATVRGSNIVDGSVVDLLLRLLGGALLRFAVGR